MADPVIVPPSEYVQTTPKGEFEKKKKKIIAAAVSDFSLLPAQTCSLTCPQTYHLMAPTGLGSSPHRDPGVLQLHCQKERLRGQSSPRVSLGSALSGRGAAMGTSTSDPVLTRSPSVEAK